MAHLIGNQAVSEVAYRIDGLARVRFRARYKTTPYQVQYRKETIWCTWMDRADLPTAILQLEGDRLSSFIQQGCKL